MYRDLLPPKSRQFYYALNHRLFLQLNPPVTWKFQVLTMLKYLFQAFADAQVYPILIYFRILTCLIDF